MYKTKLKELCQKKRWELPTYTTAQNGPGHAPRFTATVSVQDQMFESPEEFRSVKEAQNTAARIAYDHFNVPPSAVESALATVDSQFQTGLLPEKNDANTKPANGEELQNFADSISSHDKSCEAEDAEQAVAKVACLDAGLYKNRLQEFAQKKGLLHPSYETVSSGMSHRPIFVSVVTIGTDTFRGDEAKTKKQAEMNAAKVAYLALTKVTNSSLVSTIDECPVADNLSLNIQPTATIRKHHDTANEEREAKRIKAPPENSAAAVNQPWLHWKTMVIPRERN